MLKASKIAKNLSKFKKGPRWIPHGRLGNKIRLVKNKRVPTKNAKNYYVQKPSHPEVSFNSATSVLTVSGGVKDGTLTSDAIYNECF